MLGEMPNNTNQGAAFSLFGFSYGLGSLVAPTLGGLLANAADKYPNSFGKVQFFHDFPYFLPCFFSAIVSLFGFIIGFVVLKETKPRVRTNAVAIPDEDVGVVDEFLEGCQTASDGYLTASSSDQMVAELPTPSETSEDTQINDDTPLLTNDAKMSENVLVSPNFMSSEELGNEGLVESLPLLDKSTGRQPQQMHWLRRATPAIAAYMVICFTQIIFQEVYTLWCNTNVDNVRISCIYML
jgi:MFS family permease